MPPQASGALTARLASAAAPPSGPGGPSSLPRFQNGGTGRVEGKRDGELRTCGGARREKGGRPGSPSPGGAEPEARKRMAAWEPVPPRRPLHSGGPSRAVACQRRFTPRAHSKDWHTRDNVLLLHLMEAWGMLATFLTRVFTHVQHTQEQQSGKLLLCQ